MIIDFFAFFSGSNKFNVTKFSQMLGNGGLGKTAVIDKLSYIFVSTGQTRHKLKPGYIAECGN